jgi:hypothetical protein
MKAIDLQSLVVLHRGRPLLAALGPILQAGFGPGADIQSS